MTSWAGVATARLRFRVPACGTGCAPAQARSRFASMKAGSSSTTASTPKADTRWAGCSSTQRTPRGSSPVLQNRSSRPNTITSSRASTATSSSPAGTFPSTKPGVGSGCTTAGPTLAWPRPTLMSRRSSPRWRLAEAACRADATAACSRAARPGPGGLLRCGWRALRGSQGRRIAAPSLLAVLKRAPAPRLTRRLAAWCDEMAACQRGGMLMNSPDEHGRPHLWGHVQEGVLADASVVLDRPDLLTVAVNSAEAVFPEVIESGFDLPHVHSYEVQSAVFVMDRLAAVTGQPRYAEMGRTARSWFDGRNPAGAAVFDRAAGRVADGLDDGRVSDRSGAEANITACLALQGDPGVLAMARSWTRAW